MFERSAGGTATMLQITEDTPPDMLAGAMDLTVHLPTGRSVKMSVERSTPMMDLLVQITTTYQLQLSGYTLQALAMAPSKEHGDTILPYKPNTPIGALDTQHIKVLPKIKNTSVPKNVPPGHQPFESTFRLKVHLPRNQLYVTRVSHSIHLEDIMKKVCEEKNLDPLKYEFRHPGNLDEILDPKLTLSDYTITEIYLVQKGTGSLNQTFSTSDIMALRKEEERKQMHTKTGGGVFNLIFRRGKSSTGSLSSENRSISPTHSDDSRSVTPPAVQQPIITPSEPAERPKPPQRKRRPAPKPPADAAKKNDAGLTVCHSRNSSDSSGYHEASILSDNCNTSLPRRPKSTVIAEEQSTSNLNKIHSKSTSSLAFSSRKKKTAPPPPPPVLKNEKTETNLEEPSPVVASQPCIVAETETPGNGQDNVVVNNTNPIPTPRTRTKTAPSPRPRSVISVNSEDQNVEAVRGEIVEKQKPPASFSNNENPTQMNEAVHVTALHNQDQIKPPEDVTTAEPALEDLQKATQQQEDIVKAAAPPEVTEKQDDVFETKAPLPDSESKVKEPPDDKKFNDNIKQKFSELAKLQKNVVNDILEVKKEDPEKAKPPEVVALHPKPKAKENYSKSMFDSYSRKRGFKIGSSLLDLHSEEELNKKNSSDLSTPNSVASALNAFEFVDEIEDLDVEMFTGSLSKNSKNRNVILNQLHGMHEFESMKKNPSGGSLRSVSSLPGFLGGNMKKWDNVEELDEISLHSHSGRNGWVIGDTSDTESVASSTTITSQQSSSNVNKVKEEKKPTQESLPHLVDQKPKEVEETAVETETKTEDIKLPKNELEADWQYQLPSPPKAFRDSSPVTVTYESTADSVVTSPELFEKLKVVKDNQSEKGTVSDLTSVVSEEEKPILSKLSLENLEKRKSLVYNRELATSLKMPDEERKNRDTFSTSLMNFEKTYDEVKQSSLKQVVTTSTLPNFKITTYNNPKKKLDIFEDDTVRSNKRESFAETSFPLQKSFIGRSMENISFRKNTSGRNSDEEYKFFKPPAPKPQSVYRSESFTKEQRWIPAKPVSRSKSQVAINKYRDGDKVVTMEEDTLTKSNSLFDVSGLQSLGVMRQIQNKLNTPHSSMEQLDKEDQRPPVTKSEVQTQEEKTVVKTYKYRPPSVNMGTWSDRPKIPVNVKEDPDYKYSVKETTSSKLLVNSINNDIKSHNSIEVKNKTVQTSNYSNAVSVRVGPEVNNTNVSIKVNGFEPINQNSENVVIKIGGNKPVFRKPLGNVNTENQRPHSIAFGSDFDISRVPIVRSVEFKKPYKDNNNTSVTQISSNNNNFVTKNGYRDQNESTMKPQIETKPVFRVNSFLQNASAPVVRGFRSTNEQNKTWNQPHSFSTLPAKPTTRNFSLNAPVPFSQANLRRTESKSLDTKGVPPAPIMPKTVGVVKNGNNSSDPKEQLLQAIRDFGGKKGLRAVKV